MTTKLERIQRMEEELAALKAEVAEEDTLKPFDYTTLNHRAYHVNLTGYSGSWSGEDDFRFYARSEKSAEIIQRHLKLTRLLLDLKASLGDHEHEFNYMSANYFLYYRKNHWQVEESVTVNSHDIYFSTQENAQAVADYLNVNGVKP